MKFEPFLLVCRTARFSTDTACVTPTLPRSSSRPALEVSSAEDERNDPGANLEAESKDRSVKGRTKSIINWTERKETKSVRPETTEELLIWPGLERSSWIRGE